VRVLIVDDNDMGRKLLRIALRSGEIETVEAADGVEALELLETEEVDAVISDILMPRMDGYRLCLELRRKERFQALPVVIYSSTYTSASDERLAHEAGADVFLPKPAPAGEIRAALERAVASGRAHGVDRVPPPELDTLQEYSEALVRKLEERNIELKQAQDDLSVANRELRRQAARKLDAMSRMAGGIAQEYNNLLTVILGHVELTLEKTPEGTGTTAGLEDLRQASRRAAGLTRRLLEFSGQQKIEREVFDLATFVAELDRPLRSLASGRPASNRPSGMPATDLRILRGAGRAMVEADRSRLELIVTELVSNALDAMPEGGVVQIETGVVPLDEAFAKEHPPLRAGSYARLAVADTGRGMDAACQERIFEPFFTSKPLGANTGFGLAGVYGTVKQSDGYIAVRSEPGRGSRFEVYLPAYVEPPALAPPPSPRPAVTPGRAATILLVEDEDLVRRLARQLLQQAGYEVLEASRAETALELAARHSGPIELLLTDVMMPGLSGPQLAARVVAARPGIRVLYVSGYSEELLLKSSSLQPAAGFLAKPFTGDGLRRKVEDVLRGSGY
jgi:signal transduction histidine kinase